MSSVGRLQVWKSFDIFVRPKVCLYDHCYVLRPQLLFSITPGSQSTSILCRVVEKLDHEPNLYIGNCCLPKHPLKNWWFFCALLKMICGKMFVPIFCPEIFPTPKIFWASTAHFWHQKNLRWLLHVEQTPGLNSSWKIGSLPRKNFKKTWFWLEFRPCALFWGLDLQK